MRLVANIFLVVFLIFSWEVAGQQKFSSKDKKALKYYRQAENAYAKGDKKLVMLLLDKALSHDSLFVEAWLLKGDWLYDAGKNKEALKAFEHAVTIDSTFFMPVWVLMGDLYYRTGQYEKAVKAYTFYLQQENIPESKKKTVVKLFRVAQKALELTENPEGINISPLNKKINTPADEYVNYVKATSGGEMVFTRKEKVYDTVVKQLFIKESLYQVKLQDSVSPQLLGIPWLKDKNVGSLSFSADERVMYFAGCGWEQGLGSCDLYKMKRQGSRWQKPENLGRAVNTRGWESQPAVSADGKYLYFASRRRGGKGGSDLWMSVRMKNGKWSPPVNMGDSINTPGNEMAPFLYADGKTLIFSSDGRPGLGGKDLYISRRNSAGIWSEARNLGAPVNSPFDEINFVYGLDGRYGWFSSNRQGNGYDIFQVPVYKKIMPDPILFMEGRVVDDSTGKNIGNVVVLLTNLTLKKLQDSLVTDSGSGKFLIVLNKPAKYAFNLFAEGYLPYSETFDFDSSLINHWRYEKVFRLKKIKKGNSFVLQNIYFDLDQYALKAESFPELDRLVVFLKKNKNIKLNIIGHTDNTGTPQHNLQLSRQRARAIYQYLIRKGIEPERLTYKGVGARQPLVPDTTEANRAINRRVEFVVR